MTTMLTCYTNAEWLHAKSSTGPGDRIVVADHESRRTLGGLLYRVTPAGLVGPVKVLRRDDRSPWYPVIPTTEGAR